MKKYIITMLALIVPFGAVKGGISNQKTIVAQPLEKKTKLKIQSPFKIETEWVDPNQTREPVFRLGKKKVETPTIDSEGGKSVVTSSTPRCEGSCHPKGERILPPPVPARSHSEVVHNCSTTCSCSSRDRCRDDCGKVPCQCAPEPEPISTVEINWGNYGEKVVEEPVVVDIEIVEETYAPICWNVEEKETIYNVTWTTKEIPSSSVTEVRNTSRFNFEREHIPAPKCPTTYVRNTRAVNCNFTQHIPAPRCPPVKRLCPTGSYGRGYPVRQPVASSGYYNQPVVSSGYYHQPYNTYGGSTVLSGRPRMAEYVRGAGLQNHVVPPGAYGAGPRGQTRLYGVQGAPPEGIPGPTYQLGGLLASGGYR